ncbi:hypothetical protein [Bacteroides acidifaciens]|uniref:hypothetical protein n=1 Tax=Bacteroides acidifaciens TaxID=85831 RepID=UPI00242AFCEB|nr:hypothetical protein [Bacteroides acidifaciens]
MENIMHAFYEMWVESAEYNTQSAVENEKYAKCKAEILKAVGEKASYSISDNVTDLACEAEIAGFESGLRYGIMFMSGMLKGGVVA